MARLTDLDREPAEQLVARARSEDVNLVGENGLLKGLVKLVLEGALEAEMSEHLGYEKSDKAGIGTGNSRNGTSRKRVLTDVGVERVPRPATFTRQLIGPTVTSAAGPIDSGRFRGPRGNPGPCDTAADGSGQMRRAQAESRGFNCLRPCLHGTAPPTGRRGSPVRPCRQATARESRPVVPISSTYNSSDEPRPTAQP
ncbi:hypothetical protein GCM10020367_53420 [Streptomyces sannanensis]|uniref:Mutator family transposase n=1 Tax=Streptomyces sannanensis TaxID=285536 RepID=A0ABP6SJI5_9ACTN